MGAGFEASVACASDRLSRSGAADGSAEDWQADGERDEQDEHESHEAAGPAGAAR